MKKCDSYFMFLVAILTSGARSHRPFKENHAPRPAQNTQMEEWAERLRVSFSEARIRMGEFTSGITWSHLTQNLPQFPSGTQLQLHPFEITDHEMAEACKLTTGMLSGSVDRPTGMKLLGSGSLLRGGHWKAWREDSGNGNVNVILEGHFKVPREIMEKCLLDQHYQMKYDSSVVQKDVVVRRGEEKGGKQQTEVIYHIVKYPGPLANRDYVYLRRMSKSSPHTVYVQRDVPPTHAQSVVPPNKNTVRAGNGNYWAYGLIMPESDVDANGRRKAGCAVIVRSQDNLGSNVPKYIQTAIARKSTPEYVSMIERAAEALLSPGQRGDTR